MGKVTESELTRRLGKDVVYMTTGGFEHLVSELGGEFLGFSARASYGDALVVLRADFDGRYMVAFASSATVAGAIARCHRELRENKVKWQPDKFRENGG